MACCKTFLCVCAVGATALIGASGLAFAQEKPKLPGDVTKQLEDAKKKAEEALKKGTDDAKKAAQDAMGEHGGGMDDMMKMWAEKNKPTQHHAAMCPMAGEWAAECKMWMDPTAEPMVSKGTMKCMPMFDGRLFKSEFKGEMMGMPFTGYGYMGYNTTSNRYENIWMDSMSTAMVMSTGSASSDGKTITLTGQMDDCMTGQKCDVKYVWNVVDDNKNIFTMFRMVEGTEMKEGEITYTRTGGAPYKIDPKMMAGAGEHGGTEK
jgi:hypothetical protein